MNTGIVKCDTYNLDEVKKSIEKLIEVTEFPDVRGKSVLIKANILVDLPPEKVVCTHPSVIEALILILKERGASDVLCGDSPGMQTRALDPKLSGIKDAIERAGGILADLKSDSREIDAYGVKLPISKVFDTVDIVISAAKFKTHQLMLATGAVKNMLGSVPGMNKAPLHLKARKPEEFAKILIGIFEHIKPSWSIIDAVDGMEGPGPQNGTKRHVGLLIAGSNAYAVDRAEGTIMGYRELPLIKTAESLFPGVSESDFPLLKSEELVIKDYSRIPGRGDNLFKLALTNLLSLDWRRYPKFNRSKCKLCLRCVTICPGKALKPEDGGIQINKNNCIRCYCCHEMCPFDAITVK